MALTLTVHALRAAPALDAHPVDLLIGLTGGTPAPESPAPSTPGLPDVSLDSVKDALLDACGSPPGFLCRTVYDTTHSDWLASGAQLFLGTPLTIVLIVLVAAVVRTLLHRLIRRVTRRFSSTGGPLRGGLLSAFGDSAILIERRRQRAETVGSLLRSVVSIVVFGIAFVLVLGELGINLAPIVASAGVIGIAVGFGAQNLVRDFLSGIFMLLEDQYGVGDVVDVGPVAGTIEAVTFRMTRLRDVEGTVWYVRNGEITRIGNKSQQWARAVLDVPLDYGSDLARAKEIILETAKAMWREEEWSAQIIEEPELWGMETMTADGYTLRVAVKTQPLKQWDVARELRERTGVALAAAGISLGAVQRTLMVDEADEAGGAAAGGDGQGSAGPGDERAPHIDPPALTGPPSSGPSARAGGGGPAPAGGAGASGAPAPRGPDETGTAG